MAIRRLFLSSLIVAVFSLLGGVSDFNCARAFSLSDSSDAASALAGRMADEISWRLPPAAEEFDSSAKALDLRGAWGFQASDFRQGPLPQEQTSADKDALALQLLLTSAPSAGDHVVAKTAAEIKASPRTAAPIGDKCLFGSNCKVTTAAVPGSLWLVVSALVGLLGVGTRRVRMVVG